MKDADDKKCYFKFSAKAKVFDKKKLTHYSLELEYRFSVN